MGSAVFEVCDRYVVGLAALDPVWATMRGVAGAGGAGADYGPDGIEARADLGRATVAELAAAVPASPADEAAARFLRGRLDVELAMHEAGEPLRALRAPFGMLSTLRDSVDLMPKADAEDWAAVSARLAALPGMLASWRAALELGLQRGLPAARRQAVEAAAQADRYATGDTHAPVVAAYGDGPLGPGLADAARAAHGAYAETADWLRTVY